MPTIFTVMVDNHANAYAFRDDLAHAYVLYRCFGSDYDMFISPNVCFKILFRASTLPYACLRFLVIHAWNQTLRHMTLRQRIEANELRTTAAAQQPRARTRFLLFPGVYVCLMCL